jgi:sulfotransferase family protein
LKVIGAGLPRTATTTQMVALEQLGFGPCYHMRNVLMDLENELPHWEAAQEGNPDWDAAFGDAQSTVDWPSARFYAQLMDVYPDAKVLLSVRSGEGWVKSMRETVWGVYFGDSVLRHVSDARAVLDPNWRRFIELMNRMNWEDGGALAGDHQSDEGLLEIMNRWNDDVKSTVPSDRLLVWDPKEGWDPLCEFLEVDAPEAPLPHLNETAAFKEGIIGGGLELLNGWWDQRERPESGLHGAALKQ